MAGIKTVANAGDPREFIAQLEHDDQRREAAQLLELMTAASGQPAVMWGGSIIGFGSTHYRYESGREGDTCTIGFAARKGKFALYCAGSFRDQQSLLDMLGKHSMGAGCLYITSLAGVDLGVLTELLRRLYNAREPT